MPALAEGSWDRTLAPRIITLADQCLVRVQPVEVTRNSSEGNIHVLGMVTIGGRMLKRFQGDAGRRLTVDALITQKLVGGNRALAECLADRITLQEVNVGQTLIEQGSADNDVFLLFSGAFDIVVNRRRVGRRFPNDHVGEMAAIEPSQPRSASVVATEASVVARVAEADLADIGQRYPEVYRCIARELSKRLYQRNAHVGAAHVRLGLGCTGIV
jgi:CRP/FNR family transcriptional regulator, cyclic AMP receptor protein